MNTAPQIQPRDCAETDALALLEAISREAVALTATDALRAAERAIDAVVAGDGNLAVAAALDALVTLQRARAREHMRDLGRRPKRCRYLLAAVKLALAALGDHATADSVWAWIKARGPLHFPVGNGEAVVVEVDRDELIAAGLRVDRTIRRASLPRYVQAARSNGDCAKSTATIAVRVAHTLTGASSTRRPGLFTT